MKMIDKKNVEAMQKAFSATVAVFEFAHTLSGIFGGIKPPKTLMHKLHILTLNELTEEEPNIEQLDKYLYAMESLAELNAHEQKENEQKEI